MKILHVVTGRRGFLKIAPVVRALELSGEVDQSILHAGAESGRLTDLLTELGLHRPDLNLGVKAESSIAQTGRVLIALEPLVSHFEPDWIITVGDVDSSLAAALVAAKQRIPLAHIDAGLRSGDMSRPQEINRILTDRVSDALFTSEPSAHENLRAEGIPEGRIHHVGSVLIDTLDSVHERASGLRVPEAMGLEPRSYVLVAVGEARTVDDPERFRCFLEALGQIEADRGCSIILPLPPRAAANVRMNDLESLLFPVEAIEPLGYLEFVGLLEEAGVVVTDSGGVQEETTVLGVPCVTLGSATERPITVSEGTNRLFGGDLNDLVDAVDEAWKAPRRPVLWDGRAAPRIARVVLDDRWLARSEPAISAEAAR
jgi:UDP-N-acetylglucosamine 2-epimerase (non-hydrolysing)